MITIYTKPQCVQCEWTKRKMVDECGLVEGTDFTVIDVTQNQQAYETVQQSGRLEMPYVVTENDHWHGFRLDKIRGLQ